MNIYDLRKTVHVLNFCLHCDGGLITYSSSKGLNAIGLSREEMMKELIVIGSLDDDCTIEEMADYKLSQWDALSIAIRHELAREEEKSLSSFNIGKSIEKFNPNNNYY